MDERKRDLQREALLDIIFLDVGQGDIFIVTPKDERIILDAGPGDNLARYMRWRYKRFTTEAMRTMGGDIGAFILSHPDQDHYGGLQTLFADRPSGRPSESGRSSTTASSRGQGRRSTRRLTTGTLAPSITSPAPSARPRS